MTLRTLRRPRSANKLSQRPVAPDQALLSHRQACGYLSAPDSTLKKSRLTGELYGRPAPKFLKFGRGVRYARADLDAWLADSPAFQSTAEKRAAERQGVAA